jgi:TRAP-type C4-dicarboxylate transport system permease large subunit
VPLLFPAIVAYGIDPVWFGVVLVILIELGQITPPFGINLFVIQGISNSKIEDVIMGSLPYFAIFIVFVLLLVAWPDLVLWLPGRMFAPQL